LKANIDLFDYYIIAHYNNSEKSSAMKNIKLDFADFWPGFQKENNYFYNLLSAHYDIEISSQPDFLIYSVFGPAHRFYFCTRIFYNGDNPRPYYYNLDYNECDYSFSYDYIDDKRHYRLPLYALDNDYKLLTQCKPKTEDIISEKTKFCNIVVSNPDAKERTDFFHKLSEYKKVDSGGRFLNNIGQPVADKMEFMKNYKFTIAFENSSHAGYTTEKIVDAMRVHSIPIYWGNPLIHQEFNTKSFINCHDFNDFDEVIQRIIDIDNDVELYKEYLQQPYFIDNAIKDFIKEENIIQQFDFIFSNKYKIKPVAANDLKSDEALMKDLINQIIEADEIEEKLQQEFAQAKVLKIFFRKGDLLNAQLRKLELIDRFSELFEKK
jgi:alpha(1,3/1,4) fucosyltransferase